MNKILSVLLVALLMAGCGDDAVEKLEQRVDELEDELEQVKRDQSYSQGRQRSLLGLFGGDDAEPTEMKGTTKMSNYSVAQTNPPVRSRVASITTDVHSLSLVAVGSIKRLIIIDEGEGSEGLHNYNDLAEGWEEELQIKGFRLWCSSLENLKFSIDGGTVKEIEGSGPGSFAWEPGQ